MKGGKGDPDAFIEFLNQSYILWVHCFFGGRKELVDMCVRNTPDNLKWEEGAEEEHSIRKTRNKNGDTGGLKDQKDTERLRTW